MRKWQVLTNHGESIIEAPRILIESDGVLTLFHDEERTKCKAIFKSWNQIIEIEE